MAGKVGGSIMYGLLSICTHEHMQKKDKKDNFRHNIIGSVQKCMYIRWLKPSAIHSPILIFNHIIIFL